MAGVGLVALLMSLSLLLIPSVYAETHVNEQITLSEDLENNPLAQEILQKIEESKRWIAQIEQRDFEQLEKQKELEEKREQALTKLNQDLKNWEKLWEYHTFDKMLERALENNPANSTSTIYDHPLKFTAAKINAGRDALSKVLQEGGGPEKAREAYVNAAKITREEMLAANSLFNIIHNTAYYNQQILFGPDGQFDLTLSGDKLRKYYQDYRTNPAYLQANPFDKVSWEELGKNNPATECRPGYVLVHRISTDDYVCTTKYTAEMWIRHGMGTVIDSHLFETKNPVDIKKLQQDRILEKVKNLNSKITSIQQHYKEKLSDTKLEYNYIFTNMDIEKNEEEKKVIEKFDKTSMSEKTFHQQISNIREKYNQLEENVIDEKSRVLEILKNQHHTSMNDFVKNYESDSEMKLVWTSYTPTFERIE